MDTISSTSKVLSELLTEFMVDMKCEGRVKADGVKGVEVDLSNQVVRVLGSSPVKKMSVALEETGKKASLIGQGSPEGGLKENKMAPTEADIADWILYGDPTHRSIDVKEVLGISIERGRVTKRQVGALHVYIGKTQGELWRCVNPIGGNIRQYPTEVWDEVKNFLSSPNGRSDIIASRCRFEAATILRDGCLENYVLGDILLILDTVKSLIFQDDSQ